MDDKAFYSLVGVFLGWLLSQGATTAKDFLSTRRRKKGLLEELEDIDLLIGRVLMTSARQLQILTLGGCDPFAPSEIPNHFYRQYYKDVFSSLSRDQRLSYSTIHGHIDSLNKQFMTLARAREKCYDLRDSTDVDLQSNALEAWGDTVKSIYISSKELRWHVRYHLDSANLPILEPGKPEHTAFLEVGKEAKAEIKKIMEAAENLKPEQFEDDQA